MILPVIHLNFTINNIPPTLTIATGTYCMQHVSYMVCIIEVSVPYGGGREALMELAPMKNCDHLKELVLGETV